jgi:hypothetical protein
LIADPLDDRQQILRPMRKLEQEHAQMRFRLLPVADVDGRAVDANDLPLCIPRSFDAQLIPFQRPAALPLEFDGLRISASEHRSLCAGHLLRHRWRQNVFIASADDVGAAQALGRILDPHVTQLLILAEQHHIRQPQGLADSPLPRIETVVLSSAAWGRHDRGLKRLRSGAPTQP